MSKPNPYKFVSKYDKLDLCLCHYCGVEGHVRPKCFKLQNSQNVDSNRKFSQNIKFKCLKKYFFH